MGFYFGEPRRGTTKICWFQAVPKAPTDTAAEVTYAFALTVPARTTERIEILKKLPPDQLGDPHAAVYAALLFDDGNQLETANQYIAIARVGRIFPEKKQVLEEIATRRRGAAPPFAHDRVLPSPTPSPNKSTP